MNNKSFHFYLSFESLTLHQRHFTLNTLSARIALSLRSLEREEAEADSSRETRSSVRWKLAEEVFRRQP